MWWTSCARSLPGAQGRCWHRSLQRPRRIENGRGDQGRRQRRRVAATEREGDWWKREKTTLAYLSRVADRNVASSRNLPAPRCRRLRAHTLCAETGTEASRVTPAPPDGRMRQYAPRLPGTRPARVWRSRPQRPRDLLSPPRRQRRRRRDFFETLRMPDVPQLARPRSHSHCLLFQQSPHVLSVKLCHVLSVRLRPRWPDAV